LRAFKIEDTEQRESSERNMGKGMRDCVHLKLKILSSELKILCKERIIVRETWARECMIACI